MKQLIQKLTDAFSPSGYEDEIRAVLRREIQGLADEVRVDAMGNLIVRKGRASSSGKRIMVAAHMDEIGLIVTHVDERGFARFTTIGGVFPRNLPGGRVRFANGTRGVIGLEPTNSTSEVPSLDRMFIDVGASSKKDCPLRVGDVAAFERPFLDLGERLVAKSMDDRIGCAVALEALRALKSTPHEVYFVFTVQEEVGTRGAQTSAYGLDPQIGFAVDVTGVGDTPGRRGLDLALGKGPTIKIRDGGMISDPRVVDWMVRCAERNGIPYQREVLDGVTTDARAMQLVRAGVPVGCVSIPCRYVHTPSEMVDLSDVRSAVKLIAALLSSKIDFV